MKVLRSTLVAAVAVIAAACGDKVTVAGPTSPVAPGVTGVVVSPSTATLSVGQSMTLTASVTSDAGFTGATTVTWSTSDQTKVSISGTTNTVTATAAAPTPGVQICAKSTADATKQGCATVVVGAITTIPATVSIQSITINPANGGSLNTPVNPAAVVGAIDVRANVSPGTETVNKVVVMVGTTRADSQTFSASQSAALRYAVEAAEANQSAFPPILFTINTAKFNATTGAVTWPNGPYNIAVVLYVAGNANARSTATYQTPLIFANADTWLASVSTTGTTANANNATGFRYDRGALSVTALPVIFTGNTVAGATANFGSAACDAAGTGTRSIALTASGSSWTGTFSQTSTTAASSVTTYEFNGCAVSNAIGEFVTLTATNTAGDALFNATLPINANALVGIRLDNRAPDQGVLANSPTFCVNTNNRENGWINPTLGLVSTQTAAQCIPTSLRNSWIVPGPTVDAGVGGYVINLRTATSATGTNAEALAATASASPTLPAPSTTNATYCAIVTVKDLLGNESKLPAAGACPQSFVVNTPGGLNSGAGVNAQLFGVDIAPPTIVFSGGLAAGSSGAPSGTNGNQTGASVAAGGQFSVAVVDTGIVGNSGMNSGGTTAGPVMGTVTIRTAAAGLTNVQTTGAVVTLCPVGLVNSSGACTAAGGTNNGWAAPTFPTVLTALTAADAAVIGYYTYTAQSVDAAGNISTNTVTRTIAYNPAANIPTLSTALPTTVPLTGPSVTFNAIGASGNTTVNGATTFFDLWNVNYNLAYAGGLAGPLAYPATTINTYNGPTMINNNVAVGITINGFVRQVSNQTSACNAALAVGGAFKPNALNENLFDQVGLASGNVATAIAAAQVATGVSYLAVVPATQQTFTYILSTGIDESPAVGCPFAVGANTVNKVSGGGTSPSSVATSVTLTADVFGPTATFNPPFARVDFYVFNATTGNLEQLGSTTSYSTFDDGSLNGRKHRYSFTWTPGSKYPITTTQSWAAQSSAACAVPTAISLYAVGVSSAGDALVTPVNNNVCITTAP